MPDWDLSTFLFFLQTDRFEPIETIPFEDLSLKLLEPLASASGRRVGKLAEPSSLTIEKSERTFIKWLPGFRPNWDSAHSRFKQSPSIQGMKARRVLSLRHCPLRLLKVYLERREEVVRPDKDNCLWLRKVGLSSDLRKKHQGVQKVVE